MVSNVYLQKSLEKHSPQWSGVNGDSSDGQKTEDKLRRSEAYLAEAQKLSHTGSFGWNVSSGEIYWSQETFRIFEYAPTTKVTIDLILERTHPDDRSTVRQVIDRVSRERTAIDCEHRLLMPEGSVKYLRVVGRPSEDHSGSFEFVGAVIDVTERKRAEEALRQSEERFRLVVNGIDGHVAVMLPDGEVELVNQQVLDYFGKSPEELQHWRTIDAVHTDDLPRALSLWKHSVETGDPYDLDQRLRRADGAYRWFRVRGRCLRDAQGRILRWYNLLTDIDEGKRAEEALRRSEADLLQAQKLSHTGSWRHDLSTRKVTVSPEVHCIYGIDEDEDASSTEFFFSRFHPEDRQRVVELFETSESEKTGFQTDHRIVLRDGAVKHLHSVGRPVLSEAGELIEFVGSTMDVTEQVQARQKLEEALEEIKRLKDRFHDENVMLREQIDHSFMFEEIVGSSAVLQIALSSIVKVAPTDSTVLISGESGTGKELVARAIHKRSKRCGHAFVGVNCAAIPPSLIASELFGYEKGAFTGALQQRLGRFELANSGTIFLDEIGELPAETQIALLRVLQEREFERVGGNRAVHTDVRVIAATNRDLPAAITAGTFREDLYYRLNVFPIEVPPLRNRKEDIPLLIEYFVKRFAEKMGKVIKKIDKNTVELCLAYPWPGNIRELQNIVERSVILCCGETFSIDEAWLSSHGARGPEASGFLKESLEAHEKEVIEAALAKCKGRVNGSLGAAARLGIPPSTLDSKIKHLGIKKNKFVAAG